MNCVYISYTTFIAVLIYFVHYIQGKLLLYFVRYLHGYMKPFPPSLIVALRNYWMVSEELC